MKTTMQPTNERAEMSERLAQSVRSDHETLNRVMFTAAQRARVESERPAGGVAIRTQSGWELAAYRMPNGTRFVTLVDGNETTWEAYCAECRIRNGSAQPGDEQLALGVPLYRFTNALPEGAWLVIGAEVVRWAPWAELRELGAAPDREYHRANFIQAPDLTKR